MLILLNRWFYQSRVYESLRLYIQVFEELVQKGIEDGSFAYDTNVRVLRNMFLGAFSHIVLRCFLSEKVSMDKMEELTDSIDLFTDTLAVKRC